MKEQEHNSRIRRSMNWSSGFVLVNCWIQDLVACFSTICKLGPFSEVVLRFLQPGMWRKAQTTSVLVQNCYKTVHKLFLTELCTFMTGWGLSFISQVKSTWKPASPGKFSHFSTRDSFAQGWQSIPLGASFPGNLPIYSWGSFHALEPYKGLNSSVASFPYKEVWSQQPWEFRG